MSTLLLICGALRQGSFNRKLLVAAGRHWSGPTVMADLDMPLYNGDVEEAEGIPEAATRIKRQIEAADAVAIATPEYNQSISGVLKNALDWVSRGEAIHGATSRWPSCRRRPAGQAVHARSMPCGLHSTPFNRDS